MEVESTVASLESRVGHGPYFPIILNRWVQDIFKGFSSPLTFCQYPLPAFYADFFGDVDLIRRRRLHFFFPGQTDEFITVFITKWTAVRSNLRPVTRSCGKEILRSCSLYISWEYSLIFLTKKHSLNFLFLAIHLGNQHRKNWNIKVEKRERRQTRAVITWNPLQKRCRRWSSRFH